MVVLDLFSGTGSSTEAFRQAGHKVIRVEWDAQHEADLYANIGNLASGPLRTLCNGDPDFIWASPPCTAFSVASIGRHWISGGDSPVPRSAAAAESQILVQHTLRLIRELRPKFWLMENPRGMLRKMAFMKHYVRHTTAYCQYGDERQKPTDLWGVMPESWQPKPLCKRGSPCHVAAPRGATTGTQGRKGAVARSRVPFLLSLEVCQHVSAAI